MSMQRNKSLYRINKTNLFKKGVENGSVTVNTWDYEDIKGLLSTPIVKHIEQEKCLYGDWWRIGSKEKDVMKYITISTPYIVPLDTKEAEQTAVIDLIDAHYHKIFGYGKEFYIPIFLPSRSKTLTSNPFSTDSNIKSSLVLIKEWVSAHQDTPKYNFYLDLLKTVNERNVMFNELVVHREDAYSLSITFPFNLQETYGEVFEKILGSVSFKTEDYSEFYIESLLKKDNVSKVFLSQFIPNIPKLHQKSPKRFFKRK